MEKSWLRILTRNGLAILAIATAIFAIWVAVNYAKQPLLESYGFRQTQTALTSYWMMREGWQLAYQTPVAGYPWSIPFEFPLFQSLVALIAWVGNFQLDPLGRLVSFCFLIACVWPAFKITRRLGLSSDVAWVFCALLWSSPIYLFWGRTFMIETAALFFSFAAIPYALDLCDPEPRWRSAFLFAFWGTLGMLQKVTTAAPVLIVMAVVLAVVHLKTFGLRIPSWKKIACTLVAFVVPVIIGGVWAHYADLVKEQNLLGVALTSKALTKWNFGTLEQRLDLNVLKTIFWDRILLDNAAGVLGIALLGGVLYWGERRTKMIVLVSLILFALPILIFINLQFVHTYYQVSCVLFLIGALAVAVVDLSPRIIGKYSIAPAITLILVSSNLYFFSASYANDIRMPMNALNASQATTLAVGDVIRRYTPEDSGIVVFGADWSSEISYYSERKSFSVPGWLKEYDVVWNEPAAFLGDKELGAAVYCVTGNKPSLKQILERPDVKLQPKIFKVENCYLWMPEVEAIVLSGSNRTVLPMDFLDNVVDSLPQNYDVVIPASNCDGSIDIVNGVSPAPQKIVTSSLLSVDGWLAVSAKDGIAPDDIFVTLKSPSGTTEYVETHRTPRNDVNVYFKQLAMPDVGFTTTIDITALNGEYVLGLAMGYKGKLGQCEQFNIPLKIGDGN